MVFHVHVFQSPVSSLPSPRRINHGFQQRDRFKKQFNIPNIIFQGPMLVFGSLYETNRNNALWQRKTKTSQKDHAFLKGFGKITPHLFPLPKSLWNPQRSRKLPWDWQQMLRLFCGCVPMLCRQTPVSWWEKQRGKEESYKLFFLFKMGTCYSGVRSHWLFLIDVNSRPSKHGPIWAMHLPENVQLCWGFSMDDDTNFAEWAGALLEWNSELRKVRFQCLGCLETPLARKNTSRGSLLWEFYYTWIFFGDGS